MGNEPGWYLEISQTTHIVFVSDYGQSRHEFEAQPPAIDETARRTTYVAKDAKHTLTVIIEGKTWCDSMSGEVLEVAVFILMDEREYRGCGRALH